jgi:hypothetical protein
MTVADLPELVEGRAAACELVVLLVAAQLLQVPAFRLQVAVVMVEHSVVPAPTDTNL